MKVGLFFGSFNPVHNGHIAVADYLIEHTDLEEIWFIVTPQNPFKTSSSLLADHDRLAMVKQAIEGHPKLKASDIEFYLLKPSYTINTLNYLKEKFPEHQFVLITGEDNLSAFEKWKDYEQILQQCMVYVYPRIGIEKTTFHFHPKIKVIQDAPTIDISATMIRYAILNREDVSGLLPEPVRKYITDKSLYS